jgi:NAD(P)-dependent dehydrogenase (short-subunit alcohol dehydrogenase family)
VSEIAGRTVVITGAANGIGRALAEGFLRDGAYVVGADIDAEGLAALDGLGAIGVRTDVSSREQVADLVRRARLETGRLDVVINNAGTAPRGRVEDLAAGDFERVIATHLYGMVYGMQAAIPVMRHQGYGRIVNTLSRAAEIPAPGLASYSAAKAAMWAAMRAVAAETTDTDILVNGLIPGPTNTAIWGRRRPELQPPEAVYPTARMLATLPAGGPSGQVFWNLENYPLMRKQVRDRE